MDTKTKQTRFMLKAHAIPQGSIADFEAMHEVQRRQVVRSVALGEIEQLRESGIPVRTDDLDWEQALDLAERLREAEPNDVVDALRESGVPLVKGEPGTDRSKVAAEMARMPSEQREALREGATARLAEVGIPMRRLSAAEAAETALALGLDQPASDDLSDPLDGIPTKAASD